MLRWRLPAMGGGGRGAADRLGRQLQAGDMLQHHWPVTRAALV